MVKSREALLDSPEHSGGDRHWCPRSGDGDAGEETLICGITSAELRDFFRRGPLGEANEPEGQCRGWGLTRRFPWHPGRGGGMHPASCGETTAQRDQPGWRRREGKGGQEGGGSRAGRGWGGHVRPRGRGPKATPERNRFPPRGSVPGANFSPGLRD